MYDGTNFTLGDLEQNLTEMEKQGQQMTNEDARTRWESITMNLAFLLAKIKILSGVQAGEAAEWLDEQIESAGGK